MSDSHLVASSFYKDTLYSDAPFRARINIEPEVVEDKEGPDVTLGGGWLAKTSDKKQWIQVSICNGFVPTPSNIFSAVFVHLSRRLYQISRCDNERSVHRP